MIYWCAIYVEDERVADRVDLCEECFNKATKEGEDVVVYDHEEGGFCDRCGKVSA